MTHALPALALLLPVAALCCETVYRPLCEQDVKDTQIFVGTVTGQHSGRSIFRIGERLLGVPPEQTEIEVQPPPCFFQWPDNETFLIVHRRGATQELGSTEGEPIEAASRSLEFFRSRARGEHFSTVYGRVAENIQDELVRFMMDSEHRPGLSGVEVTITGGREPLRAHTNALGEYYLRIDRTGPYRLSASFEGHSSPEAEYKFDAKEDCSEINFGMWTASRFTGHVYGADGKPVADIETKILPVDGNSRGGGTGKTLADGSFEIRNVQPGDYYLGVNPGGITAEQPWEPRYFPGTSTVAGARVFHITGAETAVNLDFELTAARPRRAVEIEVRWPDGRPVINASVQCLRPGSPPESFRREGPRRYVDVAGRATCMVLADFEYTMEVDRLSWQASNRPVQPVATRQKEVVPAGIETVRLRFVMAPENDISSKEAPMNMEEYNEK